LAASLAKARVERRLDDRLLALAKPKMLIVDELGYLPEARRHSVSFGEHCREV
jgi:hypothetical protein